MSDLIETIERMHPDEQLELIKELWYEEADLFRSATRFADRKHHMERSDLLLDAHSAVVRGLGITGILGVENLVG